MRPDSIANVFRDRWFGDDATDPDGRVWIAAGRVDLWGKIIEGEHGWRAQFAYPYELELLEPIHCIPSIARPHDPDMTSALLNDIRDMYRCDVPSHHGNYT